MNDPHSLCMIISRFRCRNTKLRLSIHQFHIFPWKHKLKKDKPEQKFKTNNNLIVSFQFLQGINTKSLARHGIWKIIETERNCIRRVGKEWTNTNFIEWDENLKLGGAPMVSNHQNPKNPKWVLLLERQKPNGKEESVLYSKETL